MGPIGCALCTEQEPICVDNEHCAAECPAERDACSINPEIYPICCEVGEICCPGSVAGNDKCSPAASNCMAECPDGSTCSTAEYCQPNPIDGSYGCTDTCPAQMVCGADNVCCPLGSRCGDNGTCVLSDLSIDAERVQASAEVSWQTFQDDACVIQEGCVDAPGDRKLLRFDLKTPNTGDGDLFLGNPENNDLFEYSACHDHYHFLGYARYSLIDTNGVTVANGHKQAFCLLDFEELEPGAPPAQYHCGFQGISAGWSDIYSASLPCQWVDITDVPPGDYMLQVEVNFDKTIAESSFDNNVALVPVTIAAETCPNGCGNPDPACCADGDPCGLAANGLCDCDGFYPWDAQECSGCESCTGATTCPGGCTPPDDACCDPTNPCGLGDDGICQCAGTQAWDSVDCAQCSSADPDCVPIDTCPGGCTPNTGACCSDGDPCGWSGDGSCDCDGIAWDFLDCSSCVCP